MQWISFVTLYSFLLFWSFLVFYVCMCDRKYGLLESYQHYTWYMDTLIVACGTSSASDRKVKNLFTSIVINFVVLSFRIENGCNFDTKGSVTDYPITLFSHFLINLHEITRCFFVWTFDISIATLINHSIIAFAC